MKRDWLLYLEDIEESLADVKKYTANLTLTDFRKKQLVQDAVIRRLAIIGEAANHLQKNFSQKYPKIPWKRIVGLRNLVIHEYFAVKLERIWKLIKRDVPKLKKQIEEIGNGLAEK